MLRQQAVQQVAALGAVCSSLERGAIVTLLRRGHASQAAPAPVEAPKLPTFDYTPPPYTGPPKEEVLALRKKFLNPGKYPKGGSKCREAHRQLQAGVGQGGRAGPAASAPPLQIFSAIRHPMPMPCLSGRFHSYCIPR